VLLRLLSALDDRTLFKIDVYEMCVRTLRSAVQAALKAEYPAQDGCEVLYGRAGLLYALLLLRSGFVKSQGDVRPRSGSREDSILNQLQDLISDSTLRSIVRDLVERGEVGAKGLSSHIRSSGLPDPSLMWSWHGKMYLGAAHGVGEHHNLCGESG
jgi:Lanthionine synthetase C-like protein